MSLRRIATMTITLSLLAANPFALLKGEEKAVDKEKPKSALIEGLSIVDPDQDCEFRFLAEKLSITVPAKHHDLNAQRGMNAPRVLKKISGDFTIQVKVTSDFQPGKNSSKPQQKGRPFNGAGILIWQDDKNFLRVERNAYWVGEELYCYPPLTEYWLNGSDTDFNNTPTNASYFPEKWSWLYVERKGNHISVWISHDGDEMARERTFEVKMDHEVSVGVLAINTSDAPFTVDFDEFTIDQN